MKPYYVAPSVYLHKKGELGTFASKDLPSDFDLGCAIDLPMGTQRPSLEWMRTDLCKITNHSFKPNLKQVSHRYKLGVMVNYITNRDIKKGEELLVNYKEFDFHHMIDMSFLDPTSGRYLLYYRIVPSMLKFHKKFGICSSKRLTDVRGNAGGLIDGLFDNDGKYKYTHNSSSLNDSSILFSMFPLSEYHSTYMIPCIEFRIDTLKLSKFLPVILHKKKLRKRFHKWDEFRTDCNYDDMRKLVNIPTTDLVDPIVIGIKDVFHVDLELCERTYRVYDKEGNFKNVPIRR